MALRCSLSKGMRRILTLGTQDSDAGLCVAVVFGIADRCSNSQVRLCRFPADSAPLGNSVLNIYGFQYLPQTMQESRAKLGLEWVGYLKAKLSHDHTSMDTGVAIQVWGLKAWRVPLQIAAVLLGYDVKPPSKKVFNHGKPLFSKKTYPNTGGNTLFPDRLQNMTCLFHSPSPKSKITAFQGSWRLYTCGKKRNLGFYWPEIQVWPGHHCSSCSRASCRPTGRRHLWSWPSFPICELRMA